MLASCKVRLRQPYVCAIQRLGSSAASIGEGEGEGPRGPCALLIFHRHGDRSPLRGHTPDEELDEKGHGDADSAGGRRPAAASEGVATTTAVAAAAAATTAEEYWRRQLVQAEEVRRLDKLYPVRCSPGEAVPPDQESAPFGCLTSLGLQQLRERGARFRQRYAVDGAIGIDTSRVEVFSTNYRRTMLSAQGFLDGFLAGRGGVPVVVPPRAENFLNQWESRGHEMYGRMMAIESGSSFMETEEAVGGPLKRKLHALDPALFPLPQGGRFRWMMAADYFMSARARGLRIAPSLDALGTATIRHLAWRFGRFYRDEEMMRIMVGPLLANILECAAGSRVLEPSSGSRDAYAPASGVKGTCGRLSRVVSSSCHDVTILALLYAMESHLIHDEDYWPPYGCTIEIAVFNSQEEQESKSGEKEGASIMLEISVDGEPLRSRLLHRGETGTAVSLADFRTTLENSLPPP